MRDSRRVTQLRSYALAFAIVLSPALLQFYSCDRGDTYLLLLELDINTEARTAIFDFVEGWHNPKRRHSALDYLSPLQFERINLTPLRASS
jgi:transposase InsO family protein